ncbi:hypothetical protein [Aquimarina agarilytica]|uniref:hypothetical protein n=1 Tax=Aquimarina agarilytica TaxID=1087449 RepID=UPI00028A35AE|nr:hypothetical protein [Aquimarina agarilytica]
MADFFFFTDTDSLTGTQVKQDAFGPVNDLKYKVDNSFSVKTNAAAIAVLEGIPFVQQCIDNPDCVNVILYPINNPDFDFPTIKFFVYRGIKKSSLFGADGVISNDYSNWKANNILKVLHDLQDKINADNGDTGVDKPKPKSENIGYHYSIDGDNFKANDFYTETAIFLKDSIQLPLVKAGCQIGQFIGGSSKAGFQIIQDRLGYEPTLGEIRSKEAFIEVNAPANTTKEATFNYWHQKESILTYVDPAAFYGCAKATNKKVKAYTGQSAKKEDAEKIVNLFFNKEVVYLDIRNDQNYSYDYYDSFGKTIRLSFEQEGSDELQGESINYYNDWPLLRLENKKLPIKKSTSKIILELPFIGISDDTSKYYLSSFTHEFLPETDSKNKFHHLNQLDEKKQFLVGFSEKITLSSWTNDSDTLGANYFIFKYSSLQYSFCNSILRNSILDTLFSLDMKLLIDDKKPDDGDFNTYLYSSINAPVIDKTVGNDDSKDVYLPTIGIAKDKHHITFFAFQDKINHSSADSSLNYPLSLVRKGKYDNAVFLDEFEYDPNIKSLGFLAALPLRLQQQSLKLKKVSHPFPKNGTDENREYLYYLNPGTNNSGLSYIEPRTFDCITITIEEYDELKKLAEASKYRSFVHINQTDFRENDRYRLDEMELGIKSISLNNSKDILEQKQSFISGTDKITINGLVTKG